MRRCIKCNLEKDESEFYSRKDQVVNVCKTCFKTRSRKYRDNNKDYYKQKYREFLDRNPDYLKQYSKENNVKEKYQETSKKSSKEYYNKNREKCLMRSRDYRKTLTFSQKLQYRHGITEEQYKDMLAKQQNSCKICKNPFSDEFSDKPNIDHDHKTGKIRGLLCHHCNTALGLFLDNIDSLKSAIIYLEDGSPMEN